MEATTDASPRRLARLAGVFYLLNIITGASSLALTGRGLGGIATASNLVATVCYVVVTLLFFQLFKPVAAGEGHDASALATDEPSSPRRWGERGLRVGQEVGRVICSR